MGANQLAILLLGIIPLEIPAQDVVDIAELNHFYDEHGKLVFTQVIWWDWDKYNNRFNIRDWRLVKNRDILPISNRSVFWDGNVLREVVAGKSTESWTQVDHELASRSELPPEKRRGLSKPLKRNNPMAVTIGSNHER